MKNFLKSMALSGMLGLALMGCKDDENPDVRDAYNGTFGTDDFDVLLSIESEDSLFAVTSNPEIEFDIDDDLNPDEVAVDLNEFVTEVLEETFGKLVPLNFLPNFNQQPVVEISGGEFAIDDYEFKTTLFEGTDAIVLDSEISIEGELVGNEITFEFEMLLFVDIGTAYVFEGTVTAQRQN